MTELLYDSEASLRLIDAVLDDLRPTSGASTPCAPEAGHPALRMGPGARDAHLRAYWEVQELLDTVREGRSRIGSSVRASHLIGAPDDATVLDDGGDGLYRALLLIDRLDPAEGAAETDRSALCSELRSEIIRLIEQLRRGGEVLRHLDTTASLLYGVETRLRQVSAALDPGEPAWTGPE